LRQPEQRILSGYHFDLLGWNYKSHRDLNHHVPPEREYARYVRGCAVKLLARDVHAISVSDNSRNCGNGGTPTKEETHVAKMMLRSHFQFVGITEEWDLSVCLFHKMFGTPERRWWSKCHGSEFVNMRPGVLTKQNSSEHHAYDTSVLKGLRDDADGALYEVGLRIFQERLMAYNVTYESCRPCFEAAVGLPLPSVKVSATASAITPNSHGASIRRTFSRVDSSERPAQVARHPLSRPLSGLRGATEQVSH
jgi:hypothetical protein